MTATLIKNTRVVADSFDRRAIGPRVAIPQRSPVTWIRPRRRSAVPLTPPASSLPLAARRRDSFFALRPSSRRGLSLIEVLMSVFVLTVGLMGIAMIIPAGNTLMAQANRSDRATNCGRAGLNELQVRGWLKPGQRLTWYTKNSSGGNVPALIANTYIVSGQAFAIDPLFLSAPANSANALVQTFPYRNTTPLAAPHKVAMTRITVWDNNGTTTTTDDYNTLPFPVADRIFTWADELVFQTQTDSDRPRISANWSNGEVAYFPNLPADDDAVDPTAATPLTSVSQGNISWLATVTPVLPRTGDTPFDSDSDGKYDRMYIDVANIERYEVSIVVFHARDLYCPTTAEYGTTTPKERSVFARLDGGGIGGGDVYLMSANADWLVEIDKGDWIMLKGRQVTHAIDPTKNPNYEENVPPIISGMFAVTRDVFKWYRVVSVDDVEDSVTLPDGTTNAHGRYVTLAGPDWDVDTNFSGSFTIDDIAEAALVDDVVGVYTTIIDVNAL